MLIGGAEQIEVSSLARLFAILRWAVKFLLLLRNMQAFNMRLLLSIGYFLRLLMQFCYAMAVVTSAGDSA